ncbi:rRNA maturation RNase YbeY [Aporhodopirellula aestuarii]|uniref:Endoribonuclease YbeY n=1 Tax=Aporhodopirellula aestuarii TaxID=2950107 RepID=A0ABT0TXU7_9BACT|nr:rRNA maturation RNase YbeY [Aporhodopirellula aestuarii]MCM2369409.1 rRNA maturation RNase YbeY [Aporhodopirellula aestuarii]
MSEIEITIDARVREKVREHSTPEHPLGIAEIESAVRRAASIGNCTDCRVGVRVTDDPTIHEINREFLQHDYPTDVISFPYELQPPVVEGELVVSIDTAASEAVDVGWSVAEELLLYVIHGTLHLVGFDDTDEETRKEMREAERKALQMPASKPATP